MTFTAGTRLTAYDLNDYYHRAAYAPAPAQINQQTTIFDAGGLSVDVAPNKRYALDGYLAYESSTTGDIRFVLDAPATATGHWGLHGLHTGSSSPGSLEAYRLDAFGDANGFSIGSNAAGTVVGAWVVGYLFAGSAGGRVTVRFTQGTFDGANTIVRAGSWLRATPLD